MTTFSGTFFTIRLCRTRRRGPAFYFESGRQTAALLRDLLNEPRIKAVLDERLEPDRLYFSPASEQKDLPLAEYGNTVRRSTMCTPNLPGAI